MAKQVSFEFKGLEKLSKDLVDTFNLIIQQQKLIKEIAETIINDIRYQTRRGKSAIDGQRFKPLSKSWIKTRKDIIDRGNAHPSASPKRSNLTLSGQLMDSMKYEKTGPGKVKFYFDGDHQPYKSVYLKEFYRKVNGRKSLVKTNRSGVRTIGETIKNSDLATYVEQQGRPFFGVRPQIENRVVRLIIASIRRNYKLVSKLRSK
jgi:hypothetical protein